MLSHFCCICLEGFSSSNWAVEHFYFGRFPTPYSTADEGGKPDVFREKKPKHMVGFTVAHINIGCVFDGLCTCYIVWYIVLAWRITVTVRAPLAFLVFVSSVLDALLTWMHWNEVRRCGLDIKFFFLRVSILLIWFMVKPTARLCSPPQGFCGTPFCQCCRLFWCCPKPDSLHLIAPQGLFAPSFCWYF